MVGSLRWHYSVWINMLLLLPFLFVKMLGSFVQYIVLDVSLPLVSAGISSIVYVSWLNLSLATLLACICICAPPDLYQEFQRGRKKMRHLMIWTIS